MREQTIRWKSGYYRSTWNNREIVGQLSDDGRDFLVWGVGDTLNEAEADAIANLAKDEPVAVCCQPNK